MQRRILPAAVLVVMHPLFAASRQASAQPTGEQLISGPGYELLSGPAGTDFPAARGPPFTIQLGDGDYKSVDPSKGTTSGVGYVQSTSLLEGSGAWVLSIADGTVTITPGALPAVSLRTTTSEKGCQLQVPADWQARAGQPPEDTNAGPSNGSRTVQVSVFSPPQVSDLIVFLTSEVSSATANPDIRRVVVESAPATMSAATLANLHAESGASIQFTYRYKGVMRLVYLRALTHGQTLCLIAVDTTIEFEVQSPGLSMQILRSFQLTA